MVGEVGFVEAGGEGEVSSELEGEGGCRGALPEEMCRAGGDGGVGVGEPLVGVGGGGAPEHGDELESCVGAGDGGVPVILLEKR